MLRSGFKDPRLSIEGLAIAVWEVTSPERLQTCIGSDVNHRVVPAHGVLKDGGRIEGTVYSVQRQVPESKVLKIRVVEPKAQLMTDECAVLDVQRVNFGEDIQASHYVVVPGAEEHADMQFCVAVLDGQLSG